MSYSAILKRVVPFSLAFVAGLLIASIFIPITAPNFSRGDRGRFRGREYRQMKFEYEQIKRENEELRRSLEQLRQERRDVDQHWDSHDLKLVIPDLEIEAPKPPPAPRRPQHPHADR